MTIRRSACCATLISVLAGPGLAQDAPAAPDTSAATWQMPWQSLMDRAGGPP